jgi:hypothetical protein
VPEDIAVDLLASHIKYNQFFPNIQKEPEKLRDFHREKFLRDGPIKPLALLPSAHNAPVLMLACVFRLH